MISHDSYLGTWSRRMDWPLTMAAIGVLVAIGLVAVFSAVNPSGASAPLHDEAAHGHRRRVVRSVSSEQPQLPDFPRLSLGHLCA